MAGKRITLDGKVLDGRDEYGDWGVHTWEGWWESPAEKTDQASRPQADGDYDLPVYYQARYVTGTGIFIADNEEKMYQGMNRFTGLVRARSRLHVAGYGPDQWLDVVRASGFPITPATDTVCRWQIRVKAVNPRKYGDVRIFTGDVGAGVATWHRGNYAADPVATVSGTIAGGYRLQWGSGMVSVTQPLVPGSPHVIDFRTGRLTIGGVFIPRAIALAKTWTVAPGITQTSYVNPIAGGTGTIQWAITDTYI